MSSYIDEMMRQEYEREHRFDKPSQVGNLGGWLIMKGPWSTYYECPRCHNSESRNLNYCPNCGKKMGR